MSIFNNNMSIFDEIFFEILEAKRVGVEKYNIIVEKYKQFQKRNDPDPWPVKKIQSDEEYIDDVKAVLETKILEQLIIDLHEVTKIRFKFEQLIRLQLNYYTQLDRRERFINELNQQRVFLIAHKKLNFNFTPKYLKVKNIKEDLKLVREWNGKNKLYVSRTQSHPNSPFHTKQFNSLFFFRKLTYILNEKYKIPRANEAILIQRLTPKGEYNWLKHYLIKCVAKDYYLNQINYDRNNPYFIDKKRVDILINGGVHVASVSKPGPIFNQEYEDQITNKSGMNSAIINDKIVKPEESILKSNTEKKTKKLRKKKLHKSKQKPGDISIKSTKNRPRKEKEEQTKKLSKAQKEFEVQYFNMPKDLYTAKLDQFINKANVEWTPDEIHDYYYEYDDVDYPDFHFNPQLSYEFGGQRTRGNVYYQNNKGGINPILPIFGDYESCLNTFEGAINKTTEFCQYMAASTTIEQRTAVTLRAINNMSSAQIIEVGLGDLVRHYCKDKKVWENLEIILIPSSEARFYSTKLSSRQKLYKYFKLYSKPHKWLKKEKKEKDDELKYMSIPFGELQEHYEGYLNLKKLFFLRLTPNEWALKARIRMALAERRQRESKKIMANKFKAKMARLEMDLEEKTINLEISLEEGIKKLEEETQAVKERTKLYSYFFVKRNIGVDKEITRLEEKTKIIKQKTKLVLQKIETQQKLQKLGKTKNEVKQKKELKKQKSEIEQKLRKVKKKIIKLNKLELSEKIEISKRLEKERKQFTKERREEEREFETERQQEIRQRAKERRQEIKQLKKEAKERKKLKSAEKLEKKKQIKKDRQAEEKEEKKEKKRKKREQK